jgi:uncharacterized membrane protein HdeD (DUF308 family)
MKSIGSSVWKLLLLRGILALLFGLLAVFLPAITFSTIILWLGAWLAINGVLMMVGSFQDKAEDKNWWIAMLAGIVSLLLGIYTFMNPTVTGAIIIVYLAIWSLIVGIAEIVFAIRIRKEIKGEGWLIAGGVLSIIFGVLLLANPIQGGITLTLLLGIYAFIYGLFLVILGMRIRKTLIHL